MLNTVLTTREEVSQYKQISYTIYDDVFNSTMITTQIEDIAPLLGEELFNDILNNTSNYDDLLNGSVYEYNGITYHNYGLKSVISYYFYARYVMFGNAIDTPFSLIEKLDNEGKSQQVSQRAKEAIYQSNRQTAFTIWQNVENYLIRTNNILFNNINRCYNKENKTFKIKKIS